MMKIKVMMATGDEIYCERIEEYIQEMGIPIELSVITERDYFIRTIGKEIADIVLVAPDFADYIGADFFRRPNVFLMAQSEFEETHQYINPYQRTETLLREILLKYGELSGDVSFLFEKKTGKQTICFFSPCGGSGKTVLALALADMLAQAGKNVFYLNLDAFFRANEVFGEYEKGGFSQVLLALKQNAGNQFFVAASKNMKRSRISGVQYFSDLENPYDLEDVKEDELERLLKQMLQMKEIDIVIVDTESALTLRTKKALECSNLVFMPILDTPFCKNKVESMIEGAKVSVLLESVLKKGIWVVNKSGGYAKLAQEMGAGCVVIPELAAIKEVQTIDRIGAIMKEAIRDMYMKALEGCEL